MAIASRMAHPGSDRCPQSEKRHAATNSSISPKASPIASSASHRASARRPGVSISSAPPGSRTSSRAVVVWRPFPSSRISPVAKLDRAEPEAVRKRGLAGAGRSQEGDGRPWLEETADSLHAGAGERADRHDIAAADQALRRLDGAGDILGHVRLGQHRDRAGAALPGEDEQALEAPGPEAALERADDEDLVDVGGEHLGGVAAGTSPDDGAPSREHLDDHPALENDPVPHRRRLQRIGLVGELGRDETAQLPAFGQDREGSAIDSGDAARHGAAGGAERGRQHRTGVPSRAR